MINVDSVPIEYLPDELDIKIIKLLQADRTKTNVQIAEALGISEGTVRNRMACLETEGILRRTCVVDTARLGYSLVVGIGFQVEKGNIAECARELSFLEELSVVSITTGSFDIHAMGHFRSERELLDFMNTKLSNIESIIRRDVTHILSFEKNKFERSPLGAGRLGRRRRPSRY